MSLTKTLLTLVLRNPNKEKWQLKNVFFSNFFLVPQKVFMKAFQPSQNIFEAPQSGKITNYAIFLFQLIIL